MHPDYCEIGDPATRLIEECGELIQAICKAERFGWTNHHPDSPHITNADQVRAEMIDLIRVWESFMGPLPNQQNPADAQPVGASTDVVQDEAQ